LEFRNPELLGAAAWERRAVFDIYCENDKGEQFIVEMQKAEEDYFKDRSLYYVAHPIRAQGEKGKEWKFNLKTVYFVGILDFVFDRDDPAPLLINEVSLKNQHGKEFFDKLKMLYIQMPLFNKKESELKTRQDKWFYFLKYLPDLEDIPAIMKEKVFKKAFHKAELSVMPEKERAQYEHDLYHYRVYWATINFAKESGKKLGIAKGIAKGRAEGEMRKAVEIARNMKQKGLESSLIAEVTGLSLAEIKRLK
jgi:predicted transposase/invertase (TIGR01784 family)